MGLRKMNKTLILVTGPIGVGKSTFAEIMLRNFPFVEMEYISADLYFGVYFRNDDRYDAENYIKAKKYCRYKLDKAISSGKNFIWETVVAKEDKIAFLRKCRRYGYKIISIFISVGSPQLLIERIEERHRQGWYNIPRNKIESRFSMVMENMQTLIQLSDEFIAIDASDGYRIIFSI